MQQECRVLVMKMFIRETAMSNPPLQQLHEACCYVAACNIEALRGTRLHVPLHHRHLHNAAQPVKAYMSHCHYIVLRRLLLIHIRRRFALSQTS